jgi:PAS domain S-box-containing protein
MDLPMSMVSWSFVLFVLVLLFWFFQLYRRQVRAQALLRKALREARIVIRHFKAEHAAKEPEQLKDLNKLRGYLELMDTLINTIPAPIYFKDMEGVYQGCNKVFAQQILGLTRDRIIGRRPQDLKAQIPSDLASTYQRQEMRMVDKGGIHSFEAEVLCADGKRRDFLFNLAAIMDQDGAFSGTVAVLSDLTEKNQSAKVRMQKQKLEGVLETAGAVCHELNQPLQIISGYSELLVFKNRQPGAALEPKELEGIDKIIEQIERMRAITEKLQHITRYEAVDYSGKTRIIDISKASRH